MRNLVAGLLIGGTVLGIGAATVVTQDHNRRGTERPPTVNPPGQQRRVTVPEPAALTLLGIGVGSALAARRWAGRRRKMRE